MKQSTRYHPSCRRLRAWAQRITQDAGAPERRIRIDDLPSLLGIYARYRAHILGLATLLPSPQRLTDWTPRASRWTPEERDTRRALADPQFRRKLTRRIRARVARLLKPYLPRSLNDAGRDIRQERQDIVYALCVRLAGLGDMMACPPEVPAVPGRCLLPISRYDTRKALPRQSRVSPSYTPSRITQDDGPHIRDGSEGIHPKYLAPMPASHKADIQAYAYLPTNGSGIVECRIDGVDHYLRLPPGYAWRIDHLGLAAYRIDSPRDDYHPQAEEMRCGRISQIVVAIEGNAERRRTLVAEQAAQEAEQEGVYVCRADSLRAGNCPVGTDAWIRRHGLDAGAHISAEQIHALGELNASRDRVRLAIKAASIRTRAENAAGVCLIAGE